LITIFYARFAYLNPGVPLFLQFLHENPPSGVRAVDVSAHTPEEVSLLAEGSSTIGIDQSIENASTWAESEDFSIYRISGHHPRSFFADVADRLWSLPARRIFLSNFDLHDVRVPALIEKMRGRVDAFAWAFEKRPLTAAQIPQQYRDPWLSADYDPLYVWNMVRAVANVRIELPFSLAPHEFAGNGPRVVWDACVPGAPYATRALATKAIRAEGLSCAPTREVSRIGAGLSFLLGKTLPSERASVAAIGLQQRLQRTIVRSCASSFVCGSGVSYPTRKFFEIPGLRLPMLAYPCVGFDDYGFEHGVNVISTIPEDAGKDARWLRSDRAGAERIARRGQEKVRQLHALDVRVRDFAECLRRLDKGNLRLAEFRRGRFEIC
jgi:hypothetical protein